MIVLIDNYDSFTYNIYYYLRLVVDEVEVLKSLESFSKLRYLDPDGIVISPGPSFPDENSLSFEAIDGFYGKVPILGICLGMQFLGLYLGASVRRAKSIMHGKVDTIKITKESRMLEGLGKEFEAVRYHSLVVDGDVPVVAVSRRDGEFMALEYEAMGIYGVQFHPESYLTKNGITVIKNFLEVVDDWRDA